MIQGFKVLTRRLVVVLSALGFQPPSTYRESPLIMKNDLGANNFDVDVCQPLVIDYIYLSLAFREEP